MNDKEPIMEGKRTGRVLIFGGKQLSLGETQTQSVRNSRENTEVIG